VKGIHLMVIVGAIGAMQVASHSQGRPAAVVDDAALRNADARTADWITHGRTYGEQRFSPLTDRLGAEVRTSGCSLLGSCSVLGARFSCSVLKHEQRDA
jgi:glucose dehydrogenase